jgi:FixJ family two-component response regulator
VCDDEGIQENVPVQERTIAIIEDDASFRRALERLMRASGIEVHSFASAEEFLESAPAESFACLILDIDLPGMSGFDLVDHLSASAALPAVIFITAQDDDSLRERASVIPNTAYLRKPFVGAALLGTVRSLLKDCSKDTH